MKYRKGLAHFGHFGLSSKTHTLQSLSPPLQTAQTVCQTALALTAVPARHHTHMAHSCRPAQWRTASTHKIWAREENHL